MLHSERVSIQKEDRAFINICAFNTKEPEGIKPILTHISREYEQQNNSVGPTYTNGQII